MYTHPALTTVGTTQVTDNIVFVVNDETITLHEIVKLSTGYF